MTAIDDLYAQLGTQIAQKYGAGSPTSSQYNTNLQQYEANKPSFLQGLLTKGLPTVLGGSLGLAGGLGALGIGAAGTAGADLAGAAAGGASEPGFASWGDTGPTSGPDYMGSGAGPSGDGNSTSGGGLGGIAGFLNNPQVKSILGLGGAGLGLAGQLQQRSNVNSLMDLGKQAFGIGERAYEEKAPIRSAAYGNLGSMLAANANGPGDIFNQYFRTHPPSGATGGPSGPGPAAIGGSPAPETGSSATAGPMAAIGPAAALPGANMAMGAGNAMANIGKALGPSTPGPTLPYPGTPGAGLGPGNSRFGKLGAGAGVMY